MRLRTLNRRLVPLLLSPGGRAAVRGQFPEIRGGGHPGPAHSTPARDGGFLARRTASSRGPARVERRTSTAELRGPGGSPGLASCSAERPICEAIPGPYVLRTLGLATAGTGTRLSSISDPAARESAEARFQRLSHGPRRRTGRAAAPAPTIRAGALPMIPTSGPGSAASLRARPLRRPPPRAGPRRGSAPARLPPPAPDASPCGPRAPCPTSRTRHGASP